jgi:hypothetical protein
VNGKNVQVNTLLKYIFILNNELAAGASRPLLRIQRWFHKNGAAPAPQDCSKYYKYTRLLYACVFPYVIEKLGLVT